MPVAAVTGMPSIQIKFGADGAPWHRPMVSAVLGQAVSFDRGSSGARRLLKMACNRSVAGGYYATREESYEGNLCKDGCFTKHELVEAQRLARGIEPYEPLQTDLDRDEVRRRLATGKFPKLVAVIDDDKKEE